MINPTLSVGFFVPNILNRKKYVNPPTSFAVYRIMAQSGKWIKVQCPTSEGKPLSEGLKTCWILNPATLDEDFRKCAVIVQFLAQRIKRTLGTEEESVSCAIN